MKNNTIIALLGILIIGAIINVVIFPSKTTEDSTSVNSTEKNEVALTKTVSNTSKIFYAQSVINLRSCESLTCTSFGTYPVNNEFTLPYENINDLPEWVKIDFTDDKGAIKTGYINKTILGINKVSLPDVAVTTQTPVTSKSVASLEELQACAEQSRSNFNNIVASETKNEADLKALRTFTNHFNTTDKKCYMVITDISNEINSKTQRLYDVYDNKKLAYRWKVSNPAKPDTREGLCMITDGGDCNIDRIFEKKMESNIY